jgi:hypothetical protein
MEDGDAPPRGARAMPWRGRYGALEYGNRVMIFR